MKRLLGGACLCATTFLSSTTAFAQAQDNDAAGVSSNDIIVTAQRREERLQDVPIAINAFGGETLEAASVDSTLDLAMVTPGLFMANSAGYVRPYLRGIGTAAASAGVESSVAVYVDGVYMASQVAGLMSLTDVERVEVLKGPQGTLFGRNATGGLLHVVTRDPESVATGKFSLGYDNYETLRAEAYVAGALTEDMNASFAGNFTRQGQGYGRNLFTGEDIQLVRPEYTLRGKLAWQVGPDTDVTMSADYFRSKGSSFIGVPINGTQRRFLPPKQGGAWDSDENMPTERETQTGGASVKIVHDFGGASLTSISAYRKSRFYQFLDADNGPLSLSTSLRVWIDRQYSQELQLSGGDDGFTWVTGFYYLNSKNVQDPQDNRRAGAFGLGRALTLAQQNVRSASAFAQGTVKIAEETRLTAGLRYTDEQAVLTGSEYLYSGTGNLADPGVLIGINFENLTKKTQSSPLTWRLSLDHRFSPDVMAYLSYNRGFKSGGFNVRVPNNLGFKPERLDAYEAGLKTSLWDGRAQFNAAGFLYNYDNMQVFTIEAGAAQIYNGAKSRLYGLDADANIRVTDRFTLTGGISLLHHRFLDFPVALIGTPQPDGSYVLAPGSARGNRIPNAADVTANLGLDYVQPLGSFDLKVNLNYQYSSGFYGEPDNRLKQDPYHLINAGIELADPDDGWSLRLWGKNLANEKVATIQATAAFASLNVLQPPRTYGVTLGFGF